jgi:serine/threonine protein kinase
MRHVATGRMMAVKLCSQKLQIGDQDTPKHFFRELATLRNWKHPCIMEMVGFQLPKDGKGAAIAYEFMDNGSLLDVLTRVRAGDRPQFWTPTGIAMMIMDLVLGMKFIHSQNGIHRNLKPSNLFITNDGHLRIGDLTWCRFAGSGSKCELTKQPGSAHYQAPEIYAQDNYDLSIDLFAFGLVLYEILSLHPVFPADLAPPQVMKKLAKPELPEIPGDWTLRVRQILQSCWRKDPARRPSFDKIAFMLSEGDFQILPEVDGDAVQALVDQVDKIEAATQ